MGLLLYVDAKWISPYAFSCFVVLREKGLRFETRTVSLDNKEHHRPEYRDGSLTGRVPALEHDGFWLSESSAIAEYVEDAFPAPTHPRVLPEDLRHRARARQLMAWVRSDLMPIREERPTTTLFYQRATTPLSSDGQAAAERLLRVAEAIIPAAGGPLFGTWCIADSDFALMLNRLAHSGHPVSEKIRTYVQSQWNRPSVQEFVGQKREV